uniref:Uncharacterized protein n=1 Tax=Plectus sambesii TaxID=2011161 RepID=A0A914VVI2_9BILA
MEPINEEYNEKLYKRRRYKLSTVIMEGEELPSGGARATTDLLLYHRLLIGQAIEKKQKNAVSQRDKRRADKTRGGGCSRSVGETPQKREGPPDKRRAGRAGRSISKQRSSVVVHRLINSLRPPACRRSGGNRYQRQAASSAGEQLRCPPSNDEAGGSTTRGCTDGRTTRQPITKRRARMKTFDPRISRQCALTSSLGSPAIDGEER